MYPPPPRPAIRRCSPVFGVLTEGVRESLHGWCVDQGLYHIDLFAVILLLWSTSAPENDHRSKFIAGGASGLRPECLGVAPDQPRSFFVAVRKARHSAGP